MRWNKRKITLIILAIAILSAVLIAGSLSEIKLQDGKPFLPIAEEKPLEIPALVWSESESLQGILRILLIAFLWIVTPLAVLHFFLNPQSRKRSIYMAFIMFLNMAIIWFVLRRRMDLFQNILEINPFTPDPSQTDPAAPSLAFDPSSWWVYLLSFCLIAAFFVGLWGYWRKGRRGVAPIDMLAYESEITLRELKAGADFKDTILRCYYEMMRVLIEHRGLRRANAMTAREFADQLVAIGLPEGCVRQLTQSFERVRYSPTPLGKVEEAAAIAALSAIVKACASPT